MKLNIIIPARNEESVILSTLKDIEKKVKIAHRVIVVNDFSEDKTESVVRNYIKKRRNIVLVNNKPHRKGFAGALKTGFDKVKRGVVVFVMADSCDDSRTINIMFKKIAEGYDVVCGSRYVKGGKKIGGPMIQGFFSNLICWSIYNITKIPTKDVSNAFKMYRKVVLNKISLNMDSGVEVSMEIVMQAYFEGYKIIDVPTTWKGRKVGSSKFKLIERTPRYFRIYMMALKNTYSKM